MHRMRAVVRNLVPIGVVAALVTCSDDPTRPPPPPPPPPPSFEFVVSEPAGVPVGASAAAARNAAGAQTGDSIVYVSLLPGTVLSGRSAAIRNLTMGFSATANVVDGGFDPVPLVAGVGDSVEVVVADGSGGTTRVALAVPARRAPIVIRTVPPRGGTDVPLNSLIRVVFSEPMDPRTLTSATVRLLQNGTPVAGRIVLAADGLRADFVPDSLLARATDYTLVVEAATADLSGDVLGQSVAVGFTTGSGAPAASVAVSPSTVALAPGDTVQLTASPRDAAGNPLTGLAVAWSSSDSAVAKVSASGLVTGVTVGSATVTAIVEQQRGTATVTVVVPVASVTVSPSTVALAPGDTVRLAATPKDAAGTALTGRAVAWSSSDSAVATVSASGLVTGVAVGSATVTAIVEQQRGTATVAVAPPLSAINFTRVSSGGAHTCGLAQNGAAYCWGEGSWGQLGTGQSASLTIPTPVTGGHRFTSLAAGDYFTCGIAADEIALCWGGDDHGELGFDLADCPGGYYGCPVPTPVSGSVRFASLTGGWEHTCGVTAAGDAYCWGLSYWNQASFNRDPSTFVGIQSWTPVAITGGLKFAQVAAGFYHTCGLNPAGVAYCWGLNDVGQLGDGSTTDRRTPVAVSGSLTFAALTTHGSAYYGTAHTCAVTPAGLAYCWGANGDGQLGDGSTNASSTPVAVGAGLTFMTLSAGGAHTCGITSGGAAYCWGANNAGQLGNGSVAASSTPVAVGGGLRFASLSAGGTQTCGLASDGVAYCWGANGSGQLGDGSTTSSSVPVRVRGQP